MPDELDHEVIDSPQTLFRHLYEAHGVIEALDLDPETAPLQFWLRRHSELERAASRAAAEQRGVSQPATEAGPRGTQLPGSRPGGAPPAPQQSAPPGRSTRPGRPSRRDPPPLAQPAAEAPTPLAGPAAGTGPGGPDPGRPGPGAPGPAGPGTGSGPRFRPFADPLVEAVAVALVGRGLDERRVRRGLSSFTGADRRHGEAAVRATFVVPMLDALAARLAGDLQNRAQWPPPAWPPPQDGARREHSPRAPHRAGQGQPAPDAAARGRPQGAAPLGTPPPKAPPSGTPPPKAPPSGPAPPQPAPAAPAPDAVEESLIAQPLAGRATGPAPDADFMAIADVLQERRRSRHGGRRDATAARTSGERTPGERTPRERTPGDRTPGERTSGKRPPGGRTAGTAPSGGPDDDVMALANAIQQRRADGSR